MELSALDALENNTQRWDAVENLPLSPEAQVVLLASGVIPGWAGAVVRNKYVQHHLMEGFANSADLQERMQVALAYLDEELHLRLTGDPDEEIREILAEHSPFQSVVGVLLEASTEPWFDSLLAANRHASLDQLKVLSLRPEDATLAYLQQNPALKGAPLDDSWGAAFLLQYYPRVVNRSLGSVALTDAVSLGASWHGSLASLVEALELVSR